MSSGKTLQSELDIMSTRIDKNISDMNNFAPLNHTHEYLITNGSEKNHIGFNWYYDSTDKKYYIDVYVDGQKVRSKW